MNQGVMDFGSRVLTSEDCAGKCILEVGAQNVNGSLRDHIEAFAPNNYIGVDFANGYGVDLVTSAYTLEKFLGSSRFDLVVSTEMLEHCDDWKKAIWEMFSVCKVGGFLFISTRSPGFPYHGYPHDYWRFTIQDMQTIFMHNYIMELRMDPCDPGVMMKVRKDNSNLELNFEVAEVIK